MRNLFILLLILVAGPGPQLLAKPNPGSKQEPATILTNWMDLQCRLVRNARGVPHVAYSRHFSYSAIAAYESMAGIDPACKSIAGQVNGLETLPSARGKNLNVLASVNAAYAHMLRHFYGTFGSSTGSIDSLEKMQADLLAKQKIKGSILTESADYGKKIAALILEWAAKDGSVSTKTYSPAAGQGLWMPSPTAAVPFWSETRSFFNARPAFNYQAPVYSNEKNTDFYQMAEEVYKTGVNLSPEQKATALYWDDSPDGKYRTVFGHWTHILSGLIKQQKSSLPMAATAFVKMSMAMQEATILAWEGKYQYRVLRPINFIQENIDKNWKPLIATPNHPEFPAAHATLSNAAATALCKVFGEKCSVVDNAYVDIGMKSRSYASIKEVAKEAGYSRLYGGIHYRYSIEQGFLAGEAAARAVEGLVLFL